MPLADYAPVSAHADRRSPRAIIPETRVCIRSFVCDEIADAATRDDAAKRRRWYPPWRSASIRIGRDNTGRRSSDNNELLATDTVGNLSQPTSYVPPRLKINYDSIAATKGALLSGWLNPRGFPRHVWPERYNTRVITRIIMRIN